MQRMRCGLITNTEAYTTCTASSSVNSRGHALQNIIRQSYDYLTIIYDGRLIYETSYEVREAFLRYRPTVHLQNRKVV